MSDQLKRERESWIVQEDRRTGLLKARSTRLPCFSVCAQGMGDSLAGPALLMFCAADPTGTRAESAEEN